MKSIVASKWHGIMKNSLCAILILFVLSMILCVEAKADSENGYEYTYSINDGKLEILAYVHTQKGMEAFEKEMLSSMKASIVSVSIGSGVTGLTPDMLLY